MGRSTILALVGLVLLLAPMFFPLPGTVPGLAVVSPVVGTALVLMSAGPDAGLVRLLSCAPLKVVGLISYSAYLWHQPVFAFARAGSEGIPSGLGTLALILFILLLAAVTWRFVEQPFRGATPRLLPTSRGALTAAALASVSLIGIGLAGKESGGGAAIWALVNPGQAQELDIIQVARGEPVLTDEACHFWSLDPMAEEVRARLAECRKLHGKGILVLGDSHAVDLYILLVRLDRAPFIFAMVDGGCRPHRANLKCPFAALLTLADEDFFDLALFEQAGFDLVRAKGFLESSREMMATVGLAEPVPDLPMNDAVVAEVTTYLEQLTEFVPVVWFGPRLEPHIPLVALFDTGCSNPPALRPGLVEAFDRLDASVAAALESSKVRYLSQIQLFDFRWPVDFGNCDELFWRDGDHFTEAGGLHFGGRADVVLAARKLLATPASD